MEALVEPSSKEIKSEISVPGDKSISHRSVILGSITKGKSEVSNFLNGDDCICTINCFKQLGVSITNKSETEISIEGKKLQELQASNPEIYLGNSGTAIRLLTGLFSGLDFSLTLSGDESLNKRPMQRIIQPLSSMGASIDSSDGKAPLIINPNKEKNQLQAIHYQSPIASAQVKSAILFAGLSAEGETKVSEPHKSRDHSERMLTCFGAKLKTEGNTVSLDGSSYNDFEAQKIEVPGDISSAAFFMVAAAITDQAELIIKNVGINPTRTGIIDVFRQMQIELELENTRTVNNEEIADLVIKSSDIQGTTIGGDLIPRLIDEIPVLAVLAAQAQGKTIIKDAAELKVKESNRIATTVNILKKLGAQVEETEDGMIIEGSAKARFQNNTETIIDSNGDHRIAMASAIAALKSQNPIKILKVEFVQTSFPGFFELLQSISRYES